MAEWLVEHGIGEIRAALVEHGRILEARIRPEGVLAAGSVLPARLASIGTHGRNAVARLDDGAEVLLPMAPAGVTEGAGLRVEISRESIPGPEPWKRPLGRATAAAPCSKTLEEGLEGAPVRSLPFPPAVSDELAEAGWLELLEEAAGSSVDFPGGTLRISPTPAMTLIDVDGWMPPAELARAGAAAAAAAIRRLDIGGSIGIDLPTVRDKAARQQAAAALDSALPQPFERTAVNGFGFVQVIRRRSRASLVELHAGDRALAEARALLRRAAIGRHGPARLAAHPAVAAALKERPDWLEQLARQLGGAIHLRADPALAISGGYAEPPS